jgi:beta-glucanase (GH16 family)
MSESHTPGTRAVKVLIVAFCVAPLLGACTTTTVDSSSSVSSSGDARPSSTMAPPTGYTRKQLIFEDHFYGTKLDTSKWNTYIGSEGIRWNDRGLLPAPFSGPNTPITEETAMFAPSQVTVDNGLTLTAQRNGNLLSRAYPWISGVVTTEGKFSLPLGGWYVQVKAKMPDTRQGMWPAIWFLRGPAGFPDNELDLQEGGQEDFSRPNVEMHSDFFSDQGQVQHAVDTGVDLSAGYHVYGVQFLPNQSITGFFDGKMVWQISASSGFTITAEPYEIILQLEVASPQQFLDPGHTKTTEFTPSAAMRVAEVQAYSFSR